MLFLFVPFLFLEGTPQRTPGSLEEKSEMKKFAGEGTQVRSRPLFFLSMI